MNICTLNLIQEDELSMTARRVPQMPAHYNRDARGELGRNPLARAVVVPWLPSACPKCGSACLRDRGLEINCPCCGWEQMVRRDPWPSYPEVLR